MELLHSELAKALALAQSKFEKAVKSKPVKHNGIIKYYYAPIDKIIEAIGPSLSKNGLSFTQRLGFLDKEKYGLFTELLHVSGERESSFYLLPDPSQMRAQEFGSLLTYARRYSLSALVGVESEDDDDGQLASESKPNPQSPQTYQQKPKPKPTPPPVHHENEFDEHFEDRPSSLLEALLWEVDNKKIPHENMPAIIKKVVGKEKKSTELTDQEIKSLIFYIENMKVQT
jgi:hypothetical protein